MYSVSNNYLNALAAPVKTFRLIGTVGTVSFDESNIIDISIDNQVSEGSEIKIGSVYAGVLTATFNGLTIARGAWVGKTITLSEGLLIDADNDTYEDVPLGIFTVAEANHTAEGVEVTAYDAMTNFDKTRNDLTDTGTAYAFLTLMCQKCGVTLGSTLADIQALPNGTETFSIYAENDIETWRDLLSWIAQTLGAVATIGRDGKLYLRQYSMTAAATIDETHRFTGCSFSDFVTYYTGMSVVDIALRQTEYKSEVVDDGLTYNLGSNPLVQGHYEYVQEIIDDFSNVALTPFNAQMLGGAIYDLCDCLTFSGGIAAGATCGVMGYTWKYNGAYSVKGFGANPALATAKSKTQKELEALYNTVGQDINEMSVVQNSTAVTIAENTETSILTYNFEVTEEENTTMVDVSVVMTATATETLVGDVYTLADLIAQLRFYVDNSQVTVYDPTFIVDEGKDTMTFNYSLSGLSVGAHEFDIRLEMSGGSGSIAVGDVHEMLWGYGITFEVYVKSIAVTNPPNVSTFYSTDNIGYTGMVVSGLCNNGALIDVTSDVEIEPASGTSLSGYSTGDYEADINYVTDEGVEMTTTLPYEVIKVDFTNVVMTEKANSELSRNAFYVNNKRRKVMGAYGGFANSALYSNDKCVFGIPSSGTSVMVVFSGATSKSANYTFQNTVVANLNGIAPVEGGLVYINKRSNSNIDRYGDIYFVEGDENGVVGESLVKTISTGANWLNFWSDCNGGFSGQYVVAISVNGTTVEHVYVIDTTDGSIVYDTTDAAICGFSYLKENINTLVLDNGDVYILFGAIGRQVNPLPIYILKISNGTATMLNTSVAGEPNGGGTHSRIDYDREEECLVLTTMGVYSSGSYLTTITTRVYKLDPDDLSLIEEVTVPDYLEFHINGSWTSSGRARLYLNCTDLDYKYYSGYENRSANVNFGYATDADGAYIILGWQFLMDCRCRYYGDNATQCAKTGYFTNTLRKAMYYFDQIPYYIDNIYLQNSPGNFMGEVTV